jgi:ATP-dependent Lon protease
MTGEMTLRGRVLKIGGLKEKALAAHRYGIREIIIPVDNQSDLQDINPEIRKELKFHPVRHVDEVLELMLVKPGKPSKSTDKGPKRIPGKRPRVSPRP